MGRASRPLILEFAPFLAKPAGPLGELTLPSLRLPYLVESEVVCQVFWGEFFTMEA